MSKDTVHVVPNPNGGWSIKKGGAKRATKNFDKKQNAIEQAKVISKNNRAELIIHNKDGRIAQKHSYGHDPFPPRG